MYRTYQAYKSRCVKIISLFLAVLLAAANPAMNAAAAGETPEAVYSGTADAATVLSNMDYTDVKSSNTWAKEAIYETSALGLTKGYGEKQFGLSTPISKEQAIAMAYRVAGREAEAQRAAEALDNARKSEDKKTNPLRMWADGYLQLAANEGLISQQDFQDAINEDQTGLTETSFYRDAPAQRQEVAYWMASLLKLPPAYGQQKIFNSYRDWKSADPVKIPYIEAMLQNNIMNGDESGSFYPTGSVSREQAAQIVKNADKVIYPLAGLETKVGTIERIDSSENPTDGTVRNTYNIRNSNGKLHQIQVSYRNDAAGGYRNERSGAALPAAERELVVYKEGGIGKSSLLSSGDRIEYITDADKMARYVKVISSVNDTKYLAAQLNSVDTANLLLEAGLLFKLDYPEIGEGISFNTAGEQSTVNYRYSNNVSVFMDGKESDIAKLDAGANVILTVRDNMVTEIRTIDFKGSGREEGVIKGIVEDNNPQLGYITLYNENGSGVSQERQQEIAAFRTYHYPDRGSMEVYKNHEKATMEDVETGDSVFIKLDGDGNVAAVSAVENYRVRFAKVITKGASTLAVKYDDGTQQVLDIESSVPVIEAGRLKSYDTLKDGDRVKLLLHVTNKFTRVKEIVIQGDEHFITNIYKGRISALDEGMGKLSVANLEALDKGQWVKTGKKGIASLKLAEGYSIFANSGKLDTKRLKTLRDNEAYIAVEKDYGGNEQVVVLTLRNEDDTEVLYDDSIAGNATGAEAFSLKKNSGSIKYGTGTIVVKDGRLVAGNSISGEDAAYVVANRSYGNGSFNAGVIQISQQQDPNLVKLYRARINEINENKDFTVLSFSTLNGTDWEFANTPKTFKLTADTRILSDSGVVNQRDFADYGDNSYEDAVVYVVAKDVNTLLVSTASYGTYSARGTIFELTGMTYGQSGAVTEGPTGLKLTNAKVYNATTHLWTDSDEMTINLLKNTIIMKGNLLIKPSELKKTDTVRIVKKDGTNTGDAYVVIVEG